MTLNTFKCNCLTPLHIKGLNMMQLTVTRWQCSVQWVLYIY